MLENKHKNFFYEMSSTSLVNIDGRNSRRSVKHSEIQGQKSLMKKQENNRSLVFIEREARKVQIPCFYDVMIFWSLI